MGGDDGSRGALFLKLGFPLRKRTGNRAIILKESLGIPKESLGSPQESLRNPCGRPISLGLKKASLGNSKSLGTVMALKKALKGQKSLENSTSLGTVMALQKASKGQKDMRNFPIILASEPFFRVYQELNDRALGIPRDAKKGTIGTLGSPGIPSRN